MVTTAGENTATAPTTKRAALSRTRDTLPFVKKLSKALAKPLFAACVAGGLLGWSGEAEANGRFPQSNHIYFSPTDPDAIYLRVTFGLMVSHDRGKTWSWVCEFAIGYSGDEDPMYAFTPSGKIIGTTFQGVTSSTDNACSWSHTGGDLESKVFIDLTQNPNDAKNVFVFASSYDKQGDGGNLLFKSHVWETKDEGANYASVGGDIDPDLLGYTIDLTRSDPNRVYLTGSKNPGTAPEAFLLVSRDRGVSWTPLAVPLVDTERAVYIAAVDPLDANRVYLRTQAAVDKPTRLIVADLDPDGGAPSLRVVYQAQGALLGFALSEDASKVWIGGMKDGLRVASTSDFVFTQKSALEIQCISVAADGLWVCSNEKSGFVAGVSKDEGATFEAKLHFCDIQGPLSCPAGTVLADECAPGWPLQKSVLGCGGDLDAGVPDGGTADGGPTAPPEDSSDCDCGVVARKASPWAALGASFGIVVGLFTRRRRRR